MANNTIMTLESLKENSVRVYSGMITFSPQFSQEETLNVSEIVPKFPGCFAMNNSTVAFIDAGDFFVTPFTRTVLRSLRAAGFREEHFFVPFSNWDYPKSEQVKWTSLRKRAQDSCIEAFVEDCNDYCDKHHIGALSEDTLRNCFQMPTTGVQVKHHHFDDCYYPIINNFCLDCNAVDRIGKFCTNNGRVVFVYRDGKTYVTKGYKITAELRVAGYSESRLFVPFSNGETIVDFYLQNKWDSIIKN